MPAQQSYKNPAAHDNHGLFSDYYLNDLLPTFPEWMSDGVLHTEARNLRDELRALFQSIPNPAELSESQLEDRWIKPVLARLGHHWSVQVSIRYRERQSRKPDYVLMPDQAGADALTSRIYEPSELAAAIAAADAKKWGTPLDQTSQTRNPSQQIDEYLRYSEIRWGILTDGRIWRLYERNSSKDNDYYAVDLPALITSDAERAVENFYYFYLFFRRQAFASEGWLDRVLRESVDYAESLSDQLEDEVYEALELIAQGFLSYRRNRLTPDAATLKTIYENSLVLLYRLLFILYAESRDVLPMTRNRVYERERSLRSIVRDAALMIDLSKTHVRRVDEGGIYTRLSALSFDLDAGSSEYDIGAYNGRLFSDDEHPFLADKAVGDAFLAPALDRLARINRTERSRVLVDYRDLDVRHLGAIYEKLLDYQLAIADEPLGLRGNLYVPAREGVKPVKQTGEVYLRTGNNARKVTGSYYTPDYIVRFIVERALEPLLTEITRRYAQQDAEGHWLVADPGALRRAILALNILDPATGSGHFLVEAVSYLAGWLRGLGLRPDDLDPDEDELVYWKRQVVTSCIYGVDLNPLAVELAKLSLWLTTIARERPLSFLDHHLQVGDSLVGASLRQITTADSATPPALTAALAGAVSTMTGIETAHVAVVGDVKQQEKAYAAMRSALDPFRRLANVHTATRFGVTVSPDQWNLIYAHLAEGAAIPLDRAPEIAALLDTADAAAAGQHFFQWELAFPEVFFDDAGQPVPDGGFDAVIGNPPYVRQERIQPVKRYLEANYAVYSGTADLFLYFYERGLTLLKPEHRLGYITSGTFMNSNSAKPFRQYIHANAGLEWVANFGENQPFKGAEMVYPTITVMRRGAPQETLRNYFMDGAVARSKMGSIFAEALWQEAASNVTELDEWRFQSGELTGLFRKLVADRPTLFDTVSGRMYRGITTGLNDAFVIDEATKARLIASDSTSAEIIKPLREGQDFRPWYHLDSGQHLVWTYQGIQIDRYPAVLEHLAKYRTDLEKRWEAARKEILWYELRPCDYYNEFDKPKIFWAEIAKLPRFSRDSAGLYSTNKAHMVISDQFSLLALLNSRVLWFAISQLAVPLRLRAKLWQYQLTNQFVRRLPIPALTADQESNLSELAQQITALARDRYALHESVRHRLRADLGEGQKLNTALQSWWTLDFPAARKEINKAFKRDIPLSQRDEWEKYLTGQRASHAAATRQIVEAETRLNAIVYQAFNLTPDEIALVESTTAYPYGEG